MHPRPGDCTNWVHMNEGKKNCSILIEAFNLNSIRSFTQESNDLNPLLMTLPSPPQKKTNPTITDHSDQKYRDQ